MVIELRVVQFWSEIILVILNRTSAQREFDFEITRMISDQIALHSVQLPLFIIATKQTYRTHSPKLRLLVVDKYKLKLYILGMLKFRYYSRTCNVCTALFIL